MGLLSGLRQGGGRHSAASSPGGILMATRTAPRGRARAAEPPAAQPSNRRNSVLAGGIALGLAIIAVFGVSRIRAHREILVGATVPGTPPAPDFVLTDQNGKRMAMQDLRGKTVALTFLYTRCADICPLIANTMSAA